MRASELALCVLLGACTAGDDVPAPHISALIPDQAPGGAVIEITGNYFCQLPDVREDVPCTITGAVEFGTVPGTATLWTDTLIMVEVPQGLTVPVRVRVLAGGHTSNSITFTPS